MNKLLGSLALSLLAPAAIAQCAIFASGTSYGSGDDFIANAGTGIDIGFLFPMSGVSYQFIHPSSNGFLHLSDGTPVITDSDYTPSVAEFVTNDPRVAVLWDDLNLVGGSGGELFVDTSSANSCTITWVNAILYNTPAIQFSMSCTLHMSGQIDYSYDSTVYQTSDTIVGVSPGLGVVSPGSIDLSALVPTGDDTTFELFPANSFDLVGQVLNLIPIQPGYIPIVGVPTGCPDKSTYGIGCVSAPDAAYELFPLGAIDICATGTAVTFLRTGNSYTILDSIPGTYVPPTGAALVVSAADDAYAPVSLSTPMPTVNGPTSTLTVCTNGYIALSAAAPSAVAEYIPSVADFAAFTEPTICGPWYDWSPNAGGQIVYEEAGGIMYVTWDAVTPYQATTTDTFQYQFNMATGDCTLVFDNTSFGGTAGWHTPMFGYTNGNPVFAEAADMSVVLAGALQIFDAGAIPLAIDSNLPRLGQNWDVTTTNIDPVSPVSITFFGNGQPPVPLPLSAIGLNAPGCEVNINTILVSVTTPAVGGSATVSISIPQNAALIGSVLTAQSVCLTLANSANLLTSNGVMGTLGN